MFKFLSKLLLIAALCVPWAIQAQGDTISTFPFTCDFEDASDAGHWSYSNAANGWFIGTATNSTSGGSTSLYVSNNNGTSNSYSGSACVSYAYLTFEFDAAGQYALQFDWKCAGESTFDFLRVAVATANTTLPTSYSSWTATSVPSGFVAVDGGNKLNLAGTSWTTMNTSVSVPAAGVYRLIFVWRNDGSVYNAPPAAIDNIVITELTCPQPTSLVTLPSAYDLDVSWTPGGEESEWEIVVAGPTDTTTDYVIDTFYTATNLQPQTLYEVSVRAICDAGDTSFSTTAAVRTTCIPLDSLPYIQNFDGLTTSTTAATGVQAPCWDAILTGTSTYQTGSYVPQVYYSSTYAHSGSYSYRLYGVGYHMLPPMPVSLDSLQLNFWDYTTSSSYGLQVGVMEGNTFIPIQTINTPTSTRTEHTVYFGNYTGSSRVIAFRNYYTTSTTTYYSYHYIDDIVVDLMPSCPSIADLEVHTTASNALVTWGLQEGIPGIPTGYELTLKDSTGATTTYTTTDMSYIFSGLDAGAEYTVYVSSDCGNGEMGYADSITFTTVPLVCIERDATQTGYVELGVGQPQSTSYELPLNNYYNYSYTQQLVLASELGGENVFTAIDFQYDYSSASTAKSSDVQIYMANVSQNSLASGYVPYSASTYKLVYTGGLNCTQGWNHFVLDTAFNYDGTSNLLIVVVDNAGDYDGMDYVFKTHYAPGMAYLDYNDDDSYTVSFATGGYGEDLDYRANMKLHGYGCVQVGGCIAPYVTVDSTLTDQVDLEWLAGYSETSWDIDYRQVGTTTWNNAATSVSSTSYSITGLTPATTYEFRVYFDCNGDTVAASVYATTECELFVLPYIQDFENITTSTSSTNYDVMPVCWDYELVGSATYTTGTYLPGVYYNSSYANNGNYCLRLAGRGYHTLPPLATTLDSVVLSMNCYIASSGYNIVVGVMDAAGFFPVDTITLVSTQHTPVEVTFESYVGSSTTICLYNIYSSYDYSYVYVDDINVSYLPDCPRVTDVNLIAAGSDNATIGWAHSNSGNYEVVYGTPGFNPDDSVAIAVYGADSIDLVNLSPNSVYEVYVRELCDAGGNGAWSFGFSFRTLCGDLTVLPYIEGFEGLPVGASSNLDCGVPCWGRLDNASTYHFGYIGNPSSWSTGGHTGTGFLYYYMPTTTGTYADWIITILPPVDTTIYPINTLQLSFWVKMNSTTTSGDIQIGVISDITDPTTFVPVDTVSVAGNVYDMKTAYLSTFVGSGNRVAMKYFRDPSTATYYFVDDVTLEPMPDCPPVSDITLAGLDSNYLSVTWTENGNATSWNVEYGLHGFTPGTGTSATVTSLPFTINGLATSTEYDVYVTPECTGGTSATRMETFRTASASASLPFFCGFEGTGTNNWDFIQAGQNNYWVVGNAVSNGGSQSLYVTDDGSTNSYSGTASYSFATRTFNLQPGNYICSYDWKCNGEGSFDFIRAALVPASVNIVAGGYCGFDNASAMPAGSIALDGGYRQNLQTSWQTQITEFTLSGAGSYNLVFLWRNDGSVYNLPPAAIDNVSLMLNTCPMPTNITASNLTQTSVDIAWTEPGSATQWEYQIDNGTPVVTIDTFCTITGLVANTEYTFRVRSICGAGDTSFWAVYNFRTPCGYMTLPYEQDFETESTGSSTTGSTFVNCWTRLNNGTSYGGYPYVSSTSTYNHTAGGTKGLYWYNTTTTGTYGDYQGFVLAPVDPSVSIDSLQLSFWAKASSASYTNDFQIGVMTDPNNVSTFVGIDTVTVSGTSWTLVEVPFTGYTGAGQYIAVKSDRAAAATMCIDDILLDYVPTCLVPQNVHASEAGTTSIAIDWTDVSAASEWEIEYAAQGSTTTTSIFVTSHPYTFSNLDSLTTYTFRVRAVCTAGDTSHWSIAANLSTEMCDNAVVASTGAATGTTYYTPVNNYYKFTLSETIIDSAELAGSVDISAIAYDYAYSTPSTSKTNVTIWLQPTTKTEFSSSSDIELLDTTIAVKVYEGNLNCSQGWNYFTFDTVYTWDGHSNLMVIVDDSSNAYNGSSYVFNSSSCSGYKTLVWYSDSYHPDVFSSTYSGSKYNYNYRASMKLISCGAGCAKPANLAATNVTYNSATLNWSSNATDFEVSWKANTEATWTTPVAVSGANSYAVTGLVPETAYQFMVRALCDTTEGISSDWVIGTFTTADLPCFVPTDLQAEPSYTDATISWTARGQETQWTLHVWNSTFDQEYTVSANPYTVTGLTQSVAYNAAVKAVCGNGAAESEYSDTISFTTVTCAVVTGVTATATSGTTATVSWTPTGASVYEVNYGNRGFQQGGGRTITVNDVTTCTITDLEPASNYDIYVRALCETGVYGGWSSVAQITTPDQEGISTADGMNISIYPNPTTSSTTVALNGVAGEVAITIVDMNGRVVMSDSMSCEGDCTKTLEVTGLAQGAYFVRISGENVNMVKKLVVK